MTIQDAIDEVPEHQKASWESAWVAYRCAWNAIAPYATQFGCQAVVIAELEEAASDANIKAAFISDNKEDTMSVFAKLFWTQLSQPAQHGEIFFDPSFKSV